MSPESRGDDMKPEYELRNLRRGQYVERYRRWASRQSVSITDAIGAVEVRVVTTSADGNHGAIVADMPTVIYVSGPPQDRRDVIASAANAV